MKQPYNYSELTRIQRKAIDAFIAIDPSLISAESISRKQLEELFATAREKDPTLGYPSFLTRTIKVGRARYPWPGPESAPYVSNSDLSTVNPISDEFEQDFLQEMSESGII